MNIKKSTDKFKVVELTSKHFLGLNQPNLIIHYVTPILEEYCYDATIIHVGINDILRYKHYNELGKLPGNIKVANACQKYIIGKIYISALLPSTKTNINTFVKILQL